MYYNIDLYMTLLQIWLTQCTTCPSTSSIRSLTCSWNWSMAARCSSAPNEPSSRSRHRSITTCCRTVRSPLPDRAAPVVTAVTNPLSAPAPTLPPVLEVLSLTSLCTLELLPSLDGVLSCTIAVSTLRIKL